MEAEFPLGRFRDRSVEATRRPDPERIFDKAGLDLLFPDAAPPRRGDSHEHKPVRLKVAGFGGQGVLSLGVMLAQAARAAGRNVTWFPSYGPEQRGGTANCSVVMDDGDIGSPSVSAMDLLIAMNEPSVTRFAGDVLPGGTILHEAGAGQFGAPEGVRVIPVPAFDLAVEAGDERAANTAMFGVVAAMRLGGLRSDDFEGVLERVFARKKRVLEVNLKTFRRARDWAQSAASDLDQ
jgi:2-oxoisovalerate ferredoxin oxidoreductase beta subunit